MRFLLLCVTILVTLALGECRLRGHRKEILAKLDRISRPSSVSFHRGVKQHAHETAHDEKQHTPSIHDDDWLKLKDLKFNNDCKIECPKHHVCLIHSKHGTEKCVSKHNIKEGRRLFKKYHQRKELLKDDINGGHTGFKKALVTAEHMRDVFDLLHEYSDKPVHFDTETKHKKDKHSHKKDLSSKGGATETNGNCAPHEMYEIRKRLAGWFVMLHIESRQHHHLQHHGKGHHKHHPKQQKHKGSTTIETETHGHCKCTKSAMWEFRKLDRVPDHHLSEEERSILEHNHNEACLAPFLKSCDRNHDNRLSKMEWCCCMADVIAPCAEKAYNVKLNHGDWTPRCDREGYYEREQCQSGSCWCVDLNGNEIKGTRTHRKAHCGKYDPNGQLIKV